MKKKKFRIKNKPTFIILLCSLLLFFVLGAITFVQVGYVMLDQSKRTSMSLAENIASEIDGDQLDTIHSKQDPAYDTVYATLNKFYFYADAQYIYTMRLEKDGKLGFIVDADPEDPAEVDEPYDWVEGMAPAFEEGEVCCDQEMTTDEWGTYFSAYAPVFRSDGSVAGIVGVDIGINEINRYLKKLLTVVASVTTLFAVIYIVFYLLFSMELTGLDRLTGCMNYENLIRKGNRLQRRGELTAYTAVLINIKGFKYINRQFGYDFGNTQLKQLADFLRGGMEKKEVIARTGNDNFCVLVKKERSESYVERIRQNNPARIEAAVPGSLPAPIRCGVYDIIPGDSMEQVVGICTVVMNMARSSQKEDIIFYNKEMYENILETGDLLTAYKEAIRNGEFKVFYQPKVDIRTNTLCGAEALVRWRKDDGFISPGRFIPLLENEGLITELDFYVFDTVCNDIRLWKQQGLEPVTVSSNFSKLHMGNPLFGKNVIDAADKWQVDHKYLAVELTESSGYANMDALTDFVSRMKEVGIRVDMDDFGTGYSSLSLLGDVDVDTIKIDKSFVDRIFGQREGGKQLVRSVIRMMLELGKEVICEGVETKDQIEFLQETGCFMVQGYYFDRPLDHDTFTKRLEQKVYTDK